MPPKVDIAGARNGLGTKKSRWTFAEWTGLLKFAVRLICQAHCENSSAGRAQPCQGWGREFESRFSLKKTFGIAEGFFCEGEHQEQPYILRPSDTEPVTSHDLELTLNQSMLRFDSTFRFALATKP